MWRRGCSIGAEGSCPACAGCASCRPALPRSDAPRIQTLSTVAAVVSTRPAELIDGKAIAEDIRKELKAEVEQLKAKYGKVGRRCWLLPLPLLWPLCREQQMCRALLPRACVLLSGL